MFELHIHNAFRPGATQRDHMKAAASKGRFLGGLMDNLGRRGIARTMIERMRACSQLLRACSRLLAQQRASDSQRSRSPPSCRAPPTSPAWHEQRPHCHGLQTESRGAPAFRVETYMLLLAPYLLRDRS